MVDLIHKNEFELLRDNGVLALNEFLKERPGKFEFEFKMSDYLTTTFMHLFANGINNSRYDVYINNETTDLKDYRSWELSIMLENSGTVVENNLEFLKYIILKNDIAFEDYIEYVSLLNLCVNDISLILFFVISLGNKKF